MATTKLEDTGPQTFEKFLIPFAWRDIGFPSTDFKVSLRQDLAIHKFSDLDGAEVEATGRAPLQFDARIPFLNNIARATSETWKSGDLYPNAFRQFFAACINRSKGVLQHPEFGNVVCRVEKCDVEWKAQTRDGVYVNVSWIETFDDNGELQQNVQVAGQLAQSVQSGVDLDTLLPKLPASMIPKLPQDSPSFADFARNLQSVGDQVSLLQYQEAGKVDEIMFRTNLVLNSFSQAARTNDEAVDSVQAWPARDAADRYLMALSGIRQQLLTSGKTIGLYVTFADSSLPMIATNLPAPIGDLIALNPGLMGEYVVPAHTSVRYYLP